MLSPLYNPSYPATSGAFNEAQAAKYLSVCVKSLRKLLSNGDIYHKRIGRRVIIPKSALDDFLERDNLKSKLIAREIMR